MKLHHLRDLLAVVEEGSMSAAAKHLGTAQPALSRSIRDLEKDLGVPLLDRRARGAVPTPMGLLLVRRATAAVSELRRGRDEIRQLQGDVSGTVVACISSLAQLFNNTRIVLPHKGHPLAKARSLAELADADWITTSITGQAEAEFGAMFARHHVPPPRLALRAESALTWITAMAYTDMLAISPRQ